MPARPVLPRRAPAALLPVCLGLIGAALVWRGAAELLAPGAAPEILAELLVAGAVAAFAFVAAAYLRRVLRAPDALAVDLRRRAGAPGGTEAMMFVGVAFWPLAPALAATVWLAALALHGLLVWRILRDPAAAPPNEPALTAFLLAPFGGLMLAPMGAPAPLFWTLLAVYAVMGPAVAWRFLRRPAAPELRPAAYVLLAPPSVATMAYEAMNPGGPLGPALFALACATLAGLVAARRWMTASRLAVSWGCFTYPSAAFAGAALAMAARTEARGPDLAAVLAAGAATAVVVGVASTAFTAWTRSRVRIAPA